MKGNSQAKAIESRAEVYLMALQSLPKAEKEAVVAHLLEDPQLREDILDLAVIQQRRGEPSRPFREYLVGRGRYGK
jgi:hypothetical protein